MGVDLKELAKVIGRAVTLGEVAPEKNWLAAARAVAEFFASQQPVAATGDVFTQRDLAEFLQFVRDEHPAVDGTDDWYFDTFLEQRRAAQRTAKIDEAPQC